ESAFLAQLQRELQLEGEPLSSLHQHADQIATAPVIQAPPLLQAASSDHEIDQIILNAAILNGALEILPDSLATMSIIPLQMRMVYQIGRRSGYELGSSHIKE